MWIFYKENLAENKQTEQLIFFVFCHFDLKTKNKNWNEPDIWDKNNQIFKFSNCTLHFQSMSCHLIWDVSIPTLQLVNVKLYGRFDQIFVAFLENVIYTFSSTFSKNLQATFLHVSKLLTQPKTQTSNCFASHAFLFYIKLTQIIILDPVIQSYNFYRTGGTWVFVQSKSRPLHDRRKKIRSK